MEVFKKKSHFQGLCDFLKMKILSHVTRAHSLHSAHGEIRRFFRNELIKTKKIDSNVFENRKKLKITPPYTVQCTVQYVHTVFKRYMNHIHYTYFQ